MEATKFTEVGYVGKDVDSIIRDLVEVAVKQTFVKLRCAPIGIAPKSVEERIRYSASASARSPDGAVCW